MAPKQGKYDREYKVQAIKLSKEIGTVKAASELGIPINTLYGWQRAAREGRLDIGVGAHIPRKQQSVLQKNWEPCENR